MTPRDCGVGLAGGAWGAIVCNLPAGHAGAHTNGSGTFSYVPNKPKTPLHSFRVDDELWEAAKKRAEERGENLSDALRKFLKRYTR